MLDVSKSLFVYSMINCITVVALITIRELPTDDIIVNINKGYALQRVGAYSTDMVEEIVHTFLPLDNFCALQTTNVVCKYTSSSTTKNIMELTTIITSGHITDKSFGYNRENVSQLIAKDLNRILVQHKSDEFLRDAESNVHFINNKLHYNNDAVKSPIEASSNNTVDNSNNILRFRPTSVDMVIKQINNNKISFEYLSLVDLKLFLTMVFSNIDDSYKINNVEESLNSFSQIVVGQSIYALRYCGLNRQNSLSSKPCLAISTLFTRIPTNSPSIYSIYRLFPLPVVVNDNKYIYSNLPQIIGINYIEQTMVMWNNQLKNNKCVFSPIVLCDIAPISMSLSASSCMTQLFDDYQSVSTMCQVSQTQNIEQAVLSIDDGLWLFYNTNRTFHCQVYSSVYHLTETISIDAPAIVRIPCYKTMICPDFQLSTAVCKTNRITITPGFEHRIKNLPQFIVSIKNITHTLMSAHRIQFEKSIKDIISTFSLKQSNLHDTILEYVVYIIGGICAIILLLISHVYKSIKYTLPKKINRVDSQVQDIINF